MKDADEKTESLDHENEELVQKLTTWEKRARSHWSKWREEARKAYAFTAGDQWSGDDKAALLEQMRAPIVFNRTGPMVDAVTGAEALNRQEVRYIPREMGDVQVAEVISAAADWARDNSDAEDEESDAFHDLVVCGLGWTETRMDYEQDAEGRVQIDRIDPLEMWSDPNAKKRNLADRRFQFRAHYKSKDDLPAEWRQKIAGNGESSITDEISSSISSRGDDYDDADDDDNAIAETAADKKRVWIRHFQWYEVEPRFKIADPMTGQVAQVSEEQLGKITKMYAQFGGGAPQTAKINQRVYYEAWIAGDVILDHRPIKCNAFTYTCMTGKRDRNNGTWFGIVRALMDPQMWANKWLSQILHILNTQAKGGAFYEEGAFINERKALDDWARPDGMIAVRRGALAQGAIQQRESASYPQGLDRLLEFSVNSMPQVTGINLELLGLVQKEQAGVLEAQRKQAGYAILAVFFDGLRRYRKMQGRVLLYYIQHYMSDGRLIRIMGENGNEQYVPLTKDQGALTYDIIVDEAPMSANQKEAVWGMMVQMLPILAKQPVPGEVWAELLRYSPLPTSVSSKITQALVPQEPSPEQQMQQQSAQLQIEQQAADVEKTKAETAKIAGDAQAAGAEPQRKMAEMHINAAAKQQEMGFKAQEHQQNMQMEAQKHMATMAAQQDKTAMQLAAMQTREAMRPKGKTNGQ